MASLLPESPGLLGEQTSLLSDAMKQMQENYPAIGPYGIEARWGDPSKRGKLEFFHPDEYYNPMPGIPLIEVYDRNLTGPALQRALFGDALHYMPEVDPQFRNMRERFRTTLTPQQKESSRQRYEWYKQNWNETRPFDQWFEMSDLDAHIRGYLAPDERDEWAGSYTNEQIKLLEGMRSYLRGASR